MIKRVNHCIATAIVCAIIAALLALVIPHKAHAMPRAWQNTPVVTQGNVTYRVKGHAAVVVKTSGASVTIPAEIHYKGKWYEVKNAWSGAFKGAKDVTIHADLEGCESPRIWNHGVKVRVTRAGVYRWLKRTGANVTKIKCSDCK